MSQTYIRKLISYGVNTGLVPQEDVIYTTNRLLELFKLDELEEKPDLIILDPPRDGVNPKALQKILSYGVDSIVYISCKPTSLVRDLEAIKEAGYRPVRASAVDMFPQTLHVETVVLMSRVEGK